MSQSDELKLLPGFNPDEVHGAVVSPVKGLDVYVVPERGLEVLDVTLDGEPVMWRNPLGHRSWRSWSGAGLRPMAHIEAGFTAGVENAGAPEGHLPLHGTFSVTPAGQWRRTITGGVSGTIDCRTMVTGPSIVVERAIEPVPGKRAFRIIDRLQGRVASDYMWLYHPNFPVVDGTRLVTSETLVAPRADNIAKWGLRDYRIFSGVGRGHTCWPPATDGDGVAEENFEQCYIMAVHPDGDGVVRAMLVAPDGESAAYVSWNHDHFQPVQRAFQFWKNPRDGVSGLEVGSTFLGWTFARKHGLLATVPAGDVHVYELEIGFLRGKAEVDALAAKMPKVAEPELKTMEADQLAALYKGQFD